MDIGGESALCVGGPHNEEQLNISDVFEAITLADPSFGVGAAAGIDDSMARRDQPYVEIVEQPASKALRFRYECEGRSAGSIPGVNSTSDNKTYPTIKICGYTGQVVIVVSCVTKDEPYRAHPHNLVGRERCERGVCTIPLRVTEETCEYQFKNLGIQCVKRRDIAEALTIREKLRVDPFRKNFDHKNHPQSIDLNAVRLCFQVFLPDETGRLRRPLTPVVSDVIYDKKAMSDLLIMRSSHCSGPAKGGTQVILLCEKVTREDIEVVFYQEEDGIVVWEEIAIRILVHKQVAIAFETPAYKYPNTTDHVNVYFQLKRLSDNARSNSLPFEYYPDFSEMNIKKRKMVNDSLRNYDLERMYSTVDQQIKSEPRDRTPPHHNISSPPLHGYAPQYEQNWPMDNMQGGLGVPGPSHGAVPGGHGNPFAQDMWQNQQYGQVSPAHLQPAAMAQNLQVLQPNMQAMSPRMQAMSPGMQAMSPAMQPMSPNMQPLSPNMQAPYGAERMSPNMAVMSPHAQTMSPNMQVMSPMGRVSPNMPQNMGHISPNLVQHQTAYAQVSLSVILTKYQ
ncbi:dorsal-related immunity factor Dif isoform X2 [Spodoptera litura]|uniref:Dorsal-related immunity factor Dif isoform X2 n=2 Tax=Spodoptera litura TaxID=69820 RepID=A0A9J7IL54_SPOLT|nr:dorsal-related immunity factor Dif isoform X2 [Spodoptera litura]